MAMFISGRPHAELELVIRIAQERNRVEIVPVFEAYGETGAFVLTDRDSY
jgi:hypothetical protein